MGQRNIEGIVDILGDGGSNASCAEQLRLGSGYTRSDEDLPRGSRMFAKLIQLRLNFLTLGFACAPTAGVPILDSNEGGGHKSPELGNGAGVTSLGCLKAGGQIIFDGGVHDLIFGGRWWTSTRRTGGAPQRVSTL